LEARGDDDVASKALDRPSDHDGCGLMFEVRRNCIQLLGITLESVQTISMFQRTRHVPAVETTPTRPTLAIVAGIRVVPLGLLSGAISHRGKRAVDIFCSKNGSMRPCCVM
jgi:hypothetical protein